MKQIESSEIVGMIQTVHRVFPGAIATVCPVCSHRTRVTFPKDWAPGVVHATACGCGARLHFVIIEATNRSVDPGLWDGELWMHPPPPPNGQSREAIDLNDIDEIPDDLRDVYAEAVDLYNRRSWRASANAAGVTIEGLARLKTGLGRKTLGQLISEVAKLGFTGVAKDLLATIKDVRNGASHYDPAHPITEEIAMGMLDLSEFWIQYVYVIPRRISELVSSFGGTTDSELTDLSRRMSEIGRVIEESGIGGLAEHLKNLEAANQHYPDYGYASSTVDLAAPPTFDTDEVLQPNQADEQS